MAHLLRILFGIKFYSPEGGGGSGTSTNNASGGANNGGEPTKPNQENIETEVSKRVEEQLAKKKAEIEAKVRKEIEDAKDLTAEQKLAKEKEEFERQKQEFENQRIQQTKELNVEKVKNIYLKAGVNEELVNKLVLNVGIEFDKEKTNAEEIIKIYNKVLDDYKNKLMAEIQKKQPTPKGGSGDGGSNSDNNFFKKYNHEDTDENKKPQNKYFK